MNEYWERVAREMGLSPPKVEPAKDYWERLSMELLQRDKFFEYLLGGEFYHMLVVGPSGMGKSKLAEAIVRYLVQKQEPPCVFLLDPGGALAQQVENWALSTGLRDRMTILDPREEHFFLGFNPLVPAPDMPLSLQSKFVQEAIMAALQLDEKGKDSIFYAPQIEQILYFLCWILMERGFTFEEAPKLLAVTGTTEGREIIEPSQTGLVRQFWQDLGRLQPIQRQQLLGLVQAELLSFISSPVIQNMMGQKEHVLNFSEFIEEGRLFIGHLEPGGILTGKQTKLLMNLIISSVVRACFSRPPYTGREVFLIIDEAAEVQFPSDIGTILRRARKQGLRTILFNNDLYTILEPQPEIFSMLWTNTDHKVAFGDLPFRDLDILAREFYGEELDLKAVKDEIETVYFEPIETSREIDYESSTEASSQQQAEDESVAESRGTTLLPDGTVINNDQISAARRHGRSTGSSRSTSRGRSQVPWYEFQKGRQVTSRQFWQLEELLHQAMVRLKGLERGVIALKRRGHRVEILKVPHIPDLPEPKDRVELRNQIFQQSGHYATIEEIEAERAERLKSLQPREPPKKRWQKC